MQKIKIMRILKKLSQQDVSTVLDMDQSNYSRKESSKINISITEIQQIAQVFNVPSEIFFYDDPAFIGYLYGSFDPAEVDRVLEQVMQVEKAGV